MGGRKKIRIIPRILMNVRRYENTKKLPKQCRCQMHKAKINGTQVGENTMNRKLSTRVCSTYYDVICEAKECSKYPVQGQGGMIPRGMIKMDRPHKNTHNATF